MDRDRIIRLLKQEEPRLRQCGMASLYLFGSLAANLSRKGSDVDLFFDEIPGRGMTLFDISRVKLDLEAKLEAEIDIGTRDSLHPALRRDVESRSVQIF